MQRNSPCFNWRSRKLYIKKLVSKTRCEPENEYVDARWCGQQRMDEKHGFTCTCDGGYTLGGDKRACKVADNLLMDDVINVEPARGRTIPLAELNNAYDASYDLESCEICCALNSDNDY